METHVVISNSGHSVLYTTEEFKYLNDKGFFIGKTIIEIKSITKGK